MMPAITFNLSRSSIAPGWDPGLPDHDALWDAFAAGYLYRRVAAPATLHDSLRSTDPATGGRSDTFDAAAGSLDLMARNFPGEVSLDWSGGSGAASLRLDSAWHSIANVAVTEFSGGALTLANWVDVSLTLKPGLDRTIVVDGAKRAEIVTGAGNDSITIGVDSDGPGETNFFRVIAAGGNDTITVDSATQDYTASFVNTLYRPAWTITELHGGAGDDVIAGGRNIDRIYGGVGLDTVLLDGPRAAYQVEVFGTVVRVRDLRAGSANLDGTDRLKDIEFLQFSDALMALPQGGFGAVSEAVRLGDALTDSNPLFLTSSVDFLDDPYDPSDFGELGLGAQRLLMASPPQSLVQALSMDVLTRLLGASLRKTASEVVYDSPGPTADFLVQIGGVKIGVETTRAFSFPLESPYTLQQATDVLLAKLEDIQESSANVSAADRWEKQILHVFSPNTQAADTLTQAFAALEASLKGDTIVIVTRTDGNDHFLF